MRSLAPFFLLCTAVFPAACHGTCESSGPPSSVRMVYAVDAAAARTSGWAAEGASDAEALEEVRRAAVARVRALLPGTEVAGTYDGSGHLVLDVGADLPEDEQRILEGAVRGMGRLELFLVAEPSDVPASVNLEAEAKRAERWWAEHPASPALAYDELPPEAGGPASGLWALPSASGAVLLLCPRTLQDCFGVGNLARTSATLDNQGAPALAFAFEGRRAEDFRRFTAAHAGRKLAIVLEGRVHSAPRIDDPLPGAGVVRGQFTEDEVSALIAAFDSASLGGPLTLVEGR